MPSPKPRRRKSGLVENNVVRESPRVVTLKCGHSTKQHPLAVLGSKRFWICPEGCDGLQERKA